MVLLLFPSAPCAPMNVSASLVCNNNTAAVSWKHSPGAVSYNVTATARNGDVKRCSTNGTSCQLPNMHCAQTYIITVSPFSNSCKGYDSFPYTYIAGGRELRIRCAQFLTRLVNYEDLQFLQLPLTGLI